MVYPWPFGCPVHVLFYYQRFERADIDHTAISGTDIHHSVAGVCPKAHAGGAGTVGRRPGNDWRIPDQYTWKPRASGHFSCSIGIGRTFCCCALYLYDSSGKHLETVSHHADYGLGAINFFFVFIAFFQFA